MYAQKFIAKTANHADLAENRAAAFSTYAKCEADGEYCGYPEQIDWRTWQVQRLDI